MNYHGFLDIILGVLLAIALFKGIKMAFCKLASLVSLLLEFMRP
jgi:hypothetical protein